jgi:hypothetical protein
LVSTNDVFKFPVVLSSFYVCCKLTWALTDLPHHGANGICVRACFDFLKGCYCGCSARFPSSVRLVPTDVATTHVRWWGWPCCLKRYRSLWSWHGRYGLGCLPPLTRSIHINVGRFDWSMMHGQRRVSYPFEFKTICFFLPFELKIWKNLSKFSNFIPRQPINTTLRVELISHLSPLISTLFSTHMPWRTSVRTCKLGMTSSNPDEPSSRWVRRFLFTPSSVWCRLDWIYK